jgi:hypothetical protein
MKSILAPILAAPALIPGLMAQINPATGSGIEWGSVEHFGGLVAQFGIAFLGLYWFATRMEKRLGSMEKSSNNIEKAIDRFSKTMLLEVISRPNDVSDAARTEANKMLTDIKNRERIVAAKTNSEPPFSP